MVKLLSLQFFIFSINLARSEDNSRKKTGTSDAYSVGNYSINPQESRSSSIGKLLQRHGAQTGVELGVQRGLFAKNLLEHWPGVVDYLLVDAWTHMDNYLDGANVNSVSQNANYKEAMYNTRLWNVSVCHNFTSVCARVHQNQSFDFIYVDARHDYKGATEDIEVWFPKLNSGGIIAGHDYLTATEQTRHNKKSHWEINGDGTMDITKRGVMGAVDNFFGLKEYPLQVVDTGVPWKSWVIDTTVSYNAAHVPNVFHFVWLSVDWDHEQSAIPDQILERIAH